MLLHAHATKQKGSESRRCNRFKQSPAGAGPMTRCRRLPHVGKTAPCRPPSLGLNVHSASARARARCERKNVAVQTTLKACQSCMHLEFMCRRLEKEAPVRPAAFWRLSCCSDWSAVTSWICFSFSIPEHTFDDFHGIQRHATRASTDTIRALSHAITSRTSVHVSEHTFHAAATFS